MTRDNIIAQFLENASKVAAEPILLRGYDELNRTLSSILEGSASVYCPAMTAVEKAIKLPPDRLTTDYASASACVEEVRGGIAETGSVISTSQDGKIVQAGLLPPHHVAVVKAENIYETLDDYFATCGDSPPTNITLETGPSRTADIELTLTIGVHGPERLTILVIAPDAPHVE
jgi:L-lactate dehydrogenase complex protein LldG